MYVRMFLDKSIQNLHVSYVMLATDYDIFYDMSYNNNLFKSLYLFNFTSKISEVRLLFWCINI